ncbi:MAG: sigma 54-interacting transcriptional regulator [Thermodesulfobacteriota bacterium]
MSEFDLAAYKILVVDDEESLRLTFKMFLSKEGYGEVTTASTFEGALELIETQEFDLIISDIVMEGSSGIDLLRRVKELELKCPVVMVTGYPNINTATEAVRLGAFDYLSKPVKKAELLRTARLALQQYSLQQEKEKLEQEKNQYRAYLETIFRSVRDKIISVDPDMRIVEMNLKASQWAERALPAMKIGARIDELSDDFTVVAEDVRKAIVTREEVSEHRVEFDLKSRGHVVFRLSAAPLEDAVGNFIGVVLVARDVSRLEALEQRGNHRLRFHRLVGKSLVMQTVYTLIENVGQVDTSVLITGESGTGKELVAEALHAESPRHDMPLVKVDCTAIPEDLLESELFGHKKGSFTGADRDRQGRIIQADGGTLFLDEIGDISQRMQLRLLRFLQERTFYPVGSDTPIKVDVRVIAATNADLKQKVAEGAFREDLYYRLRVVDIIVPPLRARDGDLALLVNHFIERFSKRLDKEISGISDQAMAILEDFHWPGNIRELEHIMERACVMCSNNTITKSDISEEVYAGKPAEEAPGASAGAVSPVSPRERVADELPHEQQSEEAKIVEALKKSGGNKAKAARILGIDRSTLYRKIWSYNIDPETT